MANGERLSLAGVWQFELDPDDRGVDEAWFSRDLSGEIALPGSLQSQGFGEDVGVETKWTGRIRDRSWFTEPQYEPYRQPGNVKVVFWLQPEKHYVGAAWYRRPVSIPEEWGGKRVVLTLERAHWETRVWIDRRYVGSDDSLSTPHAYVLFDRAVPGEHWLTVRVDNRMIVEVGEDAHSVADHTQTNWNGIVGSITLHATDPVWLEDVDVFPDDERRSVLVRAHVGNATGGAQRVQLDLSVGEDGPRPKWFAAAERSFDIPAGGGQAEVMVDLGHDARRWDEFNPALYTLSARVHSLSNHWEDHRDVRFGVRRIEAAGTQLAVNGRKVFLRGTLECAAFPLTGYPPTDVEPWRRVMRTVKAYGLNHIRFHSWCPPEAAFVAADEIGVYLQVECASWVTDLGSGKKIDAWLYKEAERILKWYGNHPSFVLMASGNEPHGSAREEYLARWVSHFQQKDGRRLYTGGSAYPAIPENDYHVFHDARVMPGPTNERPPETVSDYRDLVDRFEVPVVLHEVGQWCAFPNFEEIDKYCGFLKARNFEVFRDLLKANHMGDQARDFVMASGALQVLCYKSVIESLLRTRGLAGFQLLGLQDFPGQGTAIVGVVDALWDPKEYVTSDEFRRFCDATVILARMPKRVYTNKESLDVELDIAHYGEGDLAGDVLVWRLLDKDGVPVRGGRLACPGIPSGDVSAAGRVAIDLSGLRAPGCYNLNVSLERRGCANDWDVWVYPAYLPEGVPHDPGDIIVVETLDSAVAAHLESGGKVLLVPRPEDVITDVAIDFSPVIWNTAWTLGAPPHTLGIVCDPNHPALRHFPTECHSDWQWWELIHGSRAMVLDALSPALRPIVQPIDTWFRSRRLALLFEAKVGRGKLMVCSMDLSHNISSRLAARQLRYSILQYMRSDGFSPEVHLELRELRTVLRLNGHGETERRR